MARRPSCSTSRSPPRPPAASIYKPLLIGRMRRPNGPEIVINAIPFAPARPPEHRDLRRAHQSCLLSAAPGRPHHHHRRRGFPRRLRHLPRHSEANRQEFRRPLRRLSRRHVGRHPRRLASPYTIALDYSRQTPRPAGYSRYAVALTPDLEGVEQTAGSSASSARPAPRRRIYPRLRSRTGSRYPDDPGISARHSGTA